MSGESIAFWTVIALAAVFVAIGALAGEDS